jgi:choline dehydrogenase
VVNELPVGERLMDHPIGMIRLGAPPPLADMTGPITSVLTRGDGWLAWPTSHDESRGVSSISISLAWNNPQGSLTLKSADPRVAPVIAHGFEQAIDSGLFTEPWAAMMEAAHGPVFRRSGIAVLDQGMGLREILLGNLRSHHHPAGGCCIGSVVGPDLAVRGIDGLYVADASVFPINTSNNPNWTCFMVGERAADLFDLPAYGESTPLPASEAEILSASASVSART